MEEPFALGHGAFEAFVEDLFSAVAEGELDAFGWGGGCVRSLGEGGYRGVQEGPWGVGVCSRGLLRGYVMRYEWCATDFAREEGGMVEEGTSGTLEGGVWV